MTQHVPRSGDPSGEFNLDHAVAAWRSFMATQSAVLEDDLDELETHLRDEYEAARASGLAPRAAYERARRLTGDPGSIQQTYRRVEMEKRLARRRIGTEIRARLGLCGNYFRSVRRNMSRYRAYTAANIAGLALGLGVAIVIGLYIRHSLSYDRFHPAADRTYRLLQDRGSNGLASRVAAGIAWRIRNERPEVERVTQVHGFYPYEVQLAADDRSAMLDGVLSVDEHFLDVFGFRLVATFSDNPLADPDAVLLTESTARLMFGDREALGRQLTLNTSRTLTVAGIMADPPSNTHLPFNLLVRSFREPSDVDWNRWGARVYMRLAPGASPEPLTADLTRAYQEANPGAIGGFSSERLTDIHLRSASVEPYATAGDIRYLYVFGAVAVLILLLAGINYMNLATARAAGRAREVGVRKVVGAGSGQIRAQFLLESLVIASLAVPPAVLAVGLSLPHVNALTDEHLSLQMLLTPGVVGVLVAMIVILAIGAGLYPSMIMARSLPGHIFSGSGSGGGFGAGRLGPGGRPVMRRLLVGVQVAVSFAMIAFTLLVARQLDFIRSQNLGFDEEQVVTLSPRGWSGDQAAWFLDHVGSEPAVVSAAVGVPLGLNWRLMSWRKELEETREAVQFQSISVGHNFFNTMQMDILAGRGFRPEDALGDPAPAIVSRTYADLYGGPEAVLGTVLNTGAGHEIVGVVGDIRNNSVRDRESIMTYLVTDDLPGRIVVRLAAGRIPEGLDALEAAWKEISPEQLFAYEFLDEQIEQQYTAETRLARAFGIFAGISIVIATLGLLGLAALTARRRIKEIGIRKALGATSGNILLLLSREFMAVVVVSVMLASPIVFVYGSRWLENFADRVDLTWDVFAVAGLATLLVVLVAVSAQSLRAAAMNPVDSLRTE